MGVDNAIDITPGQRKELLGLLSHHLPGVTVWAFGSRAKWTSRPDSDLDLVAFSAPEQKGRIATLKEAIEESSLPFRVDLLVWDEIPESFRENIQKAFVVLADKPEGKLNPAGMSEALFPIPSHWEPTSLGEACKRGGGDIQTGPFGSQLHASDYVPKGIPSIMPQNIGDNRISEDGIARITDEDAQRLSRYLVQPGDIVYSRRGDVERRALIRDNENGWLCGTGCLRVRFGDGAVYPPFAAYYLGHPVVRQWIVRHAQGATMPNLNTSILSALPFVLPPLEEQRAIAHILGTLDDKIELNRRMNETLEAMARAIFKSWFVDFDPVRAKASGDPPESICRRLGLTPDILALFPDRFQDSELGEIPAGWTTGTIADHCDLNAKSWTTKTLPNELRYVDLANAKSGVISEVQVFSSTEEAPSRARRILRDGDTIVGTVRPGNCSYALVSKGPQLTGSTGFAVLTPKRTELREFVYLAATDDEVIDRLSHLADGAAYPAVRPDVVTSSACLVPSDTLITSFHETCASLIDTQMSNISANATLGVMRDTLLPKLLSGELSTEEAEAVL